jgi:hypothetical protein
MAECRVPPYGWRCTRERYHDGPCAAVRIPGQHYELPVRPYPRLLRWLLRWLQGKCQHYMLRADILEGCGDDYAVRWCETCGAHCVVIDGTATPMRECRPDFEPPHRTRREYPKPAGDP